MGDCPSRTIPAASSSAKHFDFVLITNFRYTTRLLHLLRRLTRLTNASIARSIGRNHLLNNSSDIRRIRKLKGIYSTPSITEIAY
jgi:hypothetical protein